MKDRKIYIITIIALVIVVGLMLLKKFNNPYQSPKYELDEVKTADVEKRIDTIFLNYRFGMTEKEFRDHTAKLISEKKLTNNGQYDFGTEYRSYTKINPEYHNGKLYSLNLYIFPENNRFGSELLYLQMVNIYMDKYKLEHYASDLAYAYTKANLQIIIADGGSAAIVSYTDLTVKNILDKIEINKQNTKNRLNHVNI